MTINNPLRLSSEVSPLRHVLDITARSQGKDLTAYETYRALPSPTRPYSGYDYAVVAEIIRAAEVTVDKAHKKGLGSGIVTLQSVLQAYEHVLPRHGVKADEDTYYYRLLLKLSLDPALDWWIKLNRETGTTGGRAAFFSNAGSDVTSMGRSHSFYRGDTSPTRVQPRTSGAGASDYSASHSAAPTFRSSIPGNGAADGGSRVPGRNSPYRSTASLSSMPGYQQQQETAAQAAAREAAARANAAAQAARDAIEAARQAAATAHLPSSRFMFNTPPMTPAMGPVPPPSARTEGGASGWGDGSMGGAGSIVPYSVSEGGATGPGGASQYGPGSRYGPGSPHGTTAPSSVRGTYGISEHDPLSPDASAYGAGSRGTRSGGGADGGSMGGAVGPGATRASSGGGGGPGRVSAAQLAELDEPVLSEEAEAYLDYNRLARAFRMWRKNTFARKASRFERDHALKNWAVATSFWAVHLLRRCFARWRAEGPSKTALALQLWAGHSLSACFWRWLSLTRYLRGKGTECDGHWRVRTLRRCLRMWRLYTRSQQLKADNVEKALGFWVGRSLHICFRVWRQFAANQLRKNEAVQKAVGHWAGKSLRACFEVWREFTMLQQHKSVATARALRHWTGTTLRSCFALWRLLVEDAHSNWDQATQHLMRRMLLKWRIAAKQLTRMSAAYHAIADATARRVMSQAMRTLLSAHAFRHETANRLRAAVARMRNSLLSAAFNKWSEARQAGQMKRERMALALKWWSSRGLARSWNTWREAVAASQRATKAARANAQRILRPLLRDTFYAWLDWHDVRLQKEVRAVAARRTMQLRQMRLVVLGWRGLVLERRHSLVSFQRIMRNEVQRIMSTAFQRWYREHDNLRRAAEARLTVKRNATKRCLRHWRALAQAQRAHREWRLERLRLASEQRQRRLLVAWQVVAGLLAEHNRLVKSSLFKLHRRQAHSVLAAWRDRVLHSVAKRMKLLAGLLYWEQQVKGRAWLAWRQRQHGWRIKAAKGELAGRHWRTRRLALCFAVFLALWQAYQGRLTRALLFRSRRNDIIKADVLDEWRRLVGWLQWKNDKIRRALAHHRSKLGGGAFYGWYAVTRHSIATKRAVAAAVLHWVRRRRAAAFVWWRNWTAYRRDLRVRGAGYALVRAARAKEKVVLAFKANVIRKARIAGAVAHRQRYMTRLALSGWLLRTLLAADFVRRLKAVGAQLNVQLVVDGLEAWREYTIYRRTKKGMLHAALRYWRLSRQRAAMDAMRWYTTRRQLKRAVLLRGRTGAAARALRAWRDEAEYRRRLRDRYAMLASGSRHAALRRGLDMWRDYIANRASKKGLREQALRHWLRGTAGRVFRSWRDYQRHLRHAEERAGDIVQRWRKRDAAEALAAFAEYAAHRRRKRTADAMSRRSRARTALQAWREYMKLRTAEGFWSRSRLNDAIGAWRHYANHRRRLKELGAQLWGRTRRGRLASALSSWRDYATYSARLKTVSNAVRGRLQRSTVGGVFAAWRSEAKQMAALKALLERVLVRTAALAFYGWREVVADAKRWRAVQAVTQERMQQRPELAEVAMYAATRMRNWQLALAFYTWYDNARESRYLKNRASQAILLYANRLLYNAWSVWLAHTLRNRHLRKKLERCLNSTRAKTSRGVFDAWLAAAKYLGRLRKVSDLVKDKLLRGTLVGAFTSWRRTAIQFRRLRGILTRVMSRALSTAWEAWRDAVAERHERMQSLAVFVGHWRNLHLSAAFNAWVAHVHKRAAARRLCLRVLGRLLEWAWYGWREAVFEAGVSRGADVHEARLLARSWRGWRWATSEGRKAAALTAALNQAAALTAMGVWRRQWLARAAYRRLYCRRALLGWHSRTQELRAMRERLWYAARFLLNGCLLRSFSAWWQYTQAMSIKRAVWVRKQRALAEALRRGGELVAARNAELMEIAFRGWRMQTGLLREVTRRLRSIQGRTLATAFGQWREYAAVKRARLEKQAAVIRSRLLARPFRTWRAAARGAASELSAKSAAALMQRRGVLLAATFRVWRELHGVVGSRREALRRALGVVLRAEAGVLKQAVWGAWRWAVARRGDLLDLVSAVSAGRRRRVLGEVFDVWLQYTQAMRRGGIDPGSPYMSPRERGTERRLITRMAALAGNDQALAPAAHAGGASVAATDALLDGLYPSTGMQHASERRQELSAFLDFARRATSTGRAGRNGRSAAQQAAPPVYERAESISSDLSRASTGLSSGAGGADLTERAMFSVRAMPGMISPGKGRGPASGLTPAHIQLATAGRAAPAPLSARRPSGPQDFAGLSSPFDDRLDLRELYGAADQAAAAAPAPFGGFHTTAGYGARGAQLASGAASPMPLMPPPAARGGLAMATPLTASVPIAPRRIDFTASRPGSGAGAGPATGGAYGYGGPAGRGPGTPRSQQFAQPAEPAYPDDSDGASTTSSDFLPPSEARARAQQARAAAVATPRIALGVAGGALGGADVYSRTSSVTLGRSPAVGQSAARSASGDLLAGRGVSFLGGPLARPQAAAAAAGRSSILAMRNQGGNR
ncbi:hypothetical protein CHLRE_09g404500v5 [Chlamydomonas reinhardtii]|uniref:Sfi1 spindle body domain-containing protein n=1 Tax=Chlamydomonas reinhardtii TaxID=3055 RepID=A0A2K3DCL1_CHLRE|nr:uncharacterized protein CHLRE_09g404500v5 [Chlamydomonas reinhardtii]PNW78263.1 hypothetical protein CHLRE_09g404500v5 [Chlamydomonas reinhardtii]